MAHVSATPEIGSLTCMHCKRPVAVGHVCLCAACGYPLALHVVVGLGIRPCQLYGRTRLRFRPVAPGSRRPRTTEAEWREIIQRQTEAIRRHVRGRR